VNGSRARRDILFSRYQILIQPPSRVKLTGQQVHSPLSRRYRSRFSFRLPLYATLLAEYLFSHNHDTLQSAPKHVGKGIC
jgi:hypothetical protein